MESFAELLRRHRGARSLTQEHLAERAGLTTNAVGALERGERRHPYPHTVRSLADALELGPEERSTLVVASARRRLDDDRTARRPVALSSLLVAPAGSVIGRDDEVDALAAVLRRELRRVVTLTGPGGVGKTTLALAVADRVRAEFPGGVVVVELADVVEPDGVLPAVAAAFGVFVADQRVTPDMLAPALIGRRTLLLLDNLERVLDVAPTLTRLVSLCPDLVVLATSRAPLRVRSEHEARVGPLSHAAAVKLFRDHAAASGLVLDDDPETTATVEAVCSRADGLPLAIELAAAAAAVIGPTALRSRLGALSATAPRDLPARQRSLTATLAWSHELLTAPARSLLARLSVCVGGFSLNTVEEIGDGEPDAVLTSLIELLEHSLVTRVADVEGTERFRLLEPIREDAADRLDPAEREQARSGLARAMLDTARALAEDLFGPGQPVALRLLHAERCNLQEAYDHLLRGDRHDDAADLLAAVWMYFTVRARARDGTVWAARLRGTPMSDGNRIRWLIVSAALATSVGDFLEARRLAEDALAVAESRGDDEGAAFAAAVAAWNATFGRDQAGARHLVARARVHGAAAGPLHVQHQLLVATSWLAMTDGALEAADAQLREGEVLMRRLGPFERGILRFHHSSVADRRGKHGEAAALLGEAVLLFLAVESNHMVAFAVPEVAAVAVRLGDLETATRLFGAASRYIAELDVDAAFRRRYQRSRSDLAHARAGLGEAAFTAAWDAGRNFTPDDLAALARRFTGNGDVGRWAVTPSQEQGDDVDLDQDLRVEQRGDADEGLRGRR